MILPSLRKSCVSPIQRIACFATLVISASTLLAEVKVTTGYHADGAESFTFSDVPGPSKNDAATGAKFVLLDGDADSNGGGGVITNGDTQWMTAGAGILHIEKPPEWLVVSGGLFHGLQLWVNLPADQKLTAPRYQDLRASEVALVSSPDGGALIRVIAGDVAGHAGPGSTYSPMTMIHATLSPGARVSLPWRPRSTSFPSPPLSASLPGPPHMRSFPPSPLRVSLPRIPWARSLPSPALTVSSPPRAKIRSAPAVPVSVSPLCVPLMTTTR